MLVSVLPKSSIVAATVLWKLTSVLIWLIKVAFAWLACFSALTAVNSDVNASELRAMPVKAAQIGAAPIATLSPVPVSLVES